MIDLHAHILPGLDDGPESLDAAVAMAHLAAARTELAARLREEDVALELLAGGEVSLGRLPELDDGRLREFALGGGPYVLLECPFSPVDGRMDEMVEDLQRRGFQVLLAHPERSPTFQRDPARLARLVERGALAQVTTGSFAGDFGEIARRAAAAMLEQG